MPIFFFTTLLLMITLSQILTFALSFFVSFFLWMLISVVLPKNKTAKNFLQKKIKIYSSIMAIFFLIVSCRSNGFYQPYTTALELPEGPPEYQAGWRSGCRTGLSAGGRGMYVNSFVYPNVDYGDGVYHHEGLFVSGWLDAAFTCFESNSSWSIKETFQGPLE